MPNIFGTTENDTLNGTGGPESIFGFAGNDDLNGGGGDDVLHGGDGNDTLRAGAGNDLLDGGADPDTLQGQGGDDVYLWGAGDTIVENANQGIDTVITSLFFDLSADPDLENLRLDGTDNINASGNARANVVVGNAGQNNITGEQGNDTLAGGAAADTLSGGDGNDTFVFQRVGDSDPGDPDRITDFNSGVGTQEKIDVSQIDANTNVAGNDSFSFIGELTGGATPNAGQIGFVLDNVANTTTILFDINGGADEGEIVLTGLHPLTSTMFIL